MSETNTTTPLKITRTLYVGLGGTGVKAILRTKQCFIDAYGEVPPMVGFLAIDTDTAIHQQVLLSRRGTEVKLTENEVCFCGITGSALDIYKKFPDLFKWLPQRNISNLANLANQGAGAVRSNGRFLARHNGTQISSRVASKVNEISRPVDLNGKFTYDTNQDGVQYPTKINIVGSVAGGTGSGTFIDILVLIANTLRQSGLTYSITPWLVLPDVFRHMAPGVASANVYQNAYGALRELDYLYHLSPNNRNALNFQFDHLFYLDEHIGDTYLINNTNKSGIVFQNINDLTDSIGRCMFLPANEVNSVMDNTGNVKFVYNIKNKQAHYISAGSAELVYDNQAVGNVIARGIIAKICNELCQSNSTDVLKIVNSWMNSDDVAIQEHEMDLLIDSILPLYAPFGVIIDKDADINTIKANIQAGAEADHIQAEARKNATNKLEKVKLELVKKVHAILNTQNGVGECKIFLESLLDNIGVCIDEMHNEVSDLQTGLAYERNWEGELASLRTGLFNRFNKDEAELLQTKVNDYIAQKRDHLRHNIAIQFYMNLTTYAQTLLNKVNVFKTNIETIERQQRREITGIQQAANSTSHFQIFLHSNEVNNFALPNISEAAAAFRNNKPIYELIEKSAEDINNIFFDFAKTQPSVLTAVNISIEDKMRSMPDTQLDAIFSRIKDMSSPLWVTNTQGYAPTALPLTTIFTIGVYDQSTGIIQSKFANKFTLGEIKPTFATTRQTDRVTFFQTQCYVPVFAVMNMPGYKEDAANILNKECYPVYYLDESWNQRMNVEGFDVYPQQEKDSVLPNWVNALIFGFIKYDETLKSYYIESDQGDILSGGLLELGQRRDLAFEQFQLKGLDKEVEQNIQEMILTQGRPAVTDIIKSAQKDIRNYVTKYAQLSAIELDRVLAKDSSYQMVRELLEKEVYYLKELDL